MLADFLRIQGKIPKLKVTRQYVCLHLLGRSDIFGQMPIQRLNIATSVQADTLTNRATVLDLSRTVFYYLNAFQRLENKYKYLSTARD